MIDSLPAWPTYMPTNMTEGAGGSFAQSAGEQQTALDAALWGVLAKDRAC